MSVSPSLPSPAPARGVTPTWSVPIPSNVRGICLAREKGWLLAWDEQSWLHLFGRGGPRQGDVQVKTQVTAACCADDGSVIAACGSRGELWRFGPDLALRWERALSGRALAVAIDPFGQYVAIADSRGILHILDSRGETVTKLQTARPLHHLVFVPAAPQIVGCSDYGLVAGFDLAGRELWRDGLVAHIGSVAVNEDGSRVVLACFSEGLQCYTAAGKNLGRVAVSEPCRLAALSFDGELALCTGLSSHLFLLDRAGRVLYTHALDRPAAAIALGPLGDAAIVALPDGPVIGLDFRTRQTG